MSRKREFEVECVRAVRFNSETGVTHGLVKWKDFDETHTGWEPLAHLKNAPELLEEARQHLSQHHVWTWEFYLDTPSVKPSLAVGWHPYDKHSQESMNAYFAKYCVDAKQMSGQIECVQSGKFHYLIDFDAMTQTNVIVKERTQRPIRCFPSGAVAPHPTASDC